MLRSLRARGSLVPPTSGDKQTLSNFRKNFDEAERARKPYERTWRKCEEIYRGDPPTAGTKNNKRLYIPYAKQQLDTVKVRLIEPNIDFKYLPVEPQDEKQTKAVSILRRYQRRKEGYVRKQDTWAHDALIYQLAVAKVVWKRTVVRKKIRKKLNPLQQLARMPEVEEVEVVECDQPYAVVVDPFDFFWDPAATSDTDWARVFHRTWLTRDELKARAASGIYQNVDELLDNSSDGGGDDYFQRSLAETEDEGQARRRGRFEIIEEWTADGKLRVYGNRSVLLRDVDNPYWHGKIPFVTCCTQPVPRELVGFAEALQIEGLQRYMREIDNLRLEGAKVAINPPFMYRRAMKGGRDFKVIPGGRLGVDRMDDIQQLIVNPGSAFGIEEGQILLGQMQNQTGANGYLTGADSGLSQISQNTATGVSLIQQESNRMMANKMLYLQLFHARIESLALQLNQQYMSDEKRVRIVGRDGSEQEMTVSPDDIMGEYDIEPQWSSLQMNKETERQSAIELINTLSPLMNQMLPDGSTPNLKPAIERLVSSYDQDATVFFASYEAVRKAQLSEQLEEQAMMSELQQQMAPPGEAPVATQ
jgi:hypothetical protein